MVEERKRRGILDEMDDLEERRKKQKKDEGKEKAPGKDGDLDLDRIG